MHKLLTRAAQHHKGHRIIAVVLAVVAMLAGVSFTQNPALATRNLSLDDLITGSINNATQPYELQIRRTRPGSEGLELAARLVADGGYINRPISWTVREKTPGIDTPGDIVYTASAPLADMVIAPGLYQIEAHYGHALTRQTVEVLPGTRISITLILNVGGIRALTRVAGVDTGHLYGASHTIIALDARKGEETIATSVAQGQIVRLPAGRYRIESRFASGNTVAVSEITVKPGILTSMEIDHKAALARLTLGPAVTGPVNWSIRSLEEDWHKDGTARKIDIVLSPGRYEFSATVNGQQLSRTLYLQPGKATIVVLAP